MSAFRDLLKQAHEKGERKLRFVVDLDAFFANEQDKSWMCLNDMGTVSFGRTGEEALRDFVETTIENAACADGCNLK